MVVDDWSDGELDRVFHALADPTRRDILVRTMRAGESVSSLAGHYRMSFAAVQKHVAVLERAGLVNKQRHGREQIVHGDPETLRRATTLLERYERLWTDRATRIAGILADEEGNTT
ncbi:metalloregulator ArsR/SmtB family transcription factor [Actinocatenispora sera]|jgi:DNA-binding transcriptional ArsR family regulator|uniref:Transcriptional regulator n=1 Tax=Actinocatenispora sera TaxID=390989 RepID=A0A810LAY9_9ACTN|nr:metalloregulator ArsR/SmtB family transcription factor [Actinocatenispora sera]BCJ31436.1 transcriptional regulator [Actinocatenispora sera]